MSNFPDHFSATARTYAAFRPTYPVELYAFLASACAEHKRALDCATGSGQAATALTLFFAQVLAADASAAQIANRVQRDGIRYTVAQAEVLPLANATLDLITVAQAIHWFRLGTFYSEARRTLRPGGVIAVWGYNLPRINPAVDRILDELEYRWLRDDWPPQSKQLHDGYADLPFPFEKVATPSFSIEAWWSIDDLLGHLGTWSGVQRYRERTGDDILAWIGPQLAQAWGEPGQARLAIWPLAVRVGRV